MASPLEQFVHNVRTLSSQGNFRDLCDILHKSTDLLLKNGQHLDTVLEMLDLQQHSLAMLEVLGVKLSLLLQTPSRMDSRPSKLITRRFCSLRYTNSSPVASQNKSATRQSLMRNSATSPPSSWWRRKCHFEESS
uniref:COP9 signalosome complex subunit 3 n=1 Tax=Lygus hesperus TaxID=30085 RepID=A0A0A9VUZ6_LYGHE